MGYSVYRFHDGDVLEPMSGLTLNEAFTRMMALAECAYLATLAIFPSSFPRLRCPRISVMCSS
jgi:hypothetical protein